jgi:hypothetical protein
MKLQELFEQQQKFSDWFSDSKITDERGNPTVMYHGTTVEVSEFEENTRGLYYVSPAPQWVSDFISANKDFPEGTNILPVYVAASNPFDFENKNHVNRVAKAASLGQLAISQIRKGSWTRLEDRTLINTIKSLGFDGMYVKERGVKNLAVFSPKQLRSVFSFSEVK